MTFFLKSTTQPFNPVTRCTALTQVLVSFRENVQMWVWFSQDSLRLGFFQTNWKHPSGKANESLMKCLLFIAVVHLERINHEAIAQFRLKTRRRVFYACPPFGSTQTGPAAKLRQNEMSNLERSGGTEQDGLWVPIWDARLRAWKW